MTPFSACQSWQIGDFSVNWPHPLLEIGQDCLVGFSVHDQLPKNLSLLCELEALHIFVSILCPPKTHDASH